MPFFLWWDMLIGVISDTHDHHRNVARAVDIFNERGVRYVLHAGDIVSPLTAGAFAEVQDAKFLAVFGNCDADRSALRAAIDAFGGEVHDTCYEGVIDSRSVRMAHRPDAVREAARSQACDLVIYGHTHRHDIQRVGRTLIVNPGAARNWMTSPGRVVVLDLADMSYSTEILR